MSIARTIEVAADFGDNLISAVADFNKSIEANAEITTTVQHVHVDGGALPTGGVYGDILMKRSDEDYDSEWIAPATSAEEDNTRPITAGAVYTEIGNINALLSII